MFTKRLLLSAGLIAIAGVVGPDGALAQDDLTKQLAAIEQSLWKGWAEGDVTPFEKHLQANAVQIGAWGMAEGKEDLVAAIAAGGCTVEGYELEDWKVHRVSDDTAILTYEAEQKGACDGVELDPELYVSAVYVLENGAWKSASYQETPAADDESDR